MDQFVSDSPDILSLFFSIIKHKGLTPFGEAKTRRNSQISKIQYTTTTQPIKKKKNRYTIL